MPFKDKKKFIQLMQGSVSVKQMLTSINQSENINIQK